MPRMLSGTRRPEDVSDEWARPFVPFRGWRRKGTMGDAEFQPGTDETPACSPLCDGEGVAGAMPADGPGESEGVEPDLYADHRFLCLFFNIQGSVWKYIVRTGLISLIPSLAISICLAFIAGGGGDGMPQFSREAGVVLLLVSVVIISPILETLLLGLTLWIVSFVTKKPLRQALVTCVIWAVLHSLAAWLWGLVVIWPFFVFSCAYLAWRRRSWWHAMGVACGIHVFQNLLPGILIAAT